MTAALRRRGLGARRRDGLGCGGLRATGPTTTTAAARAPLPPYPFPVGFRAHRAGLGNNGPIVAALLLTRGILGRSRISFEIVRAHRFVLTWRRSKRAPICRPRTAIAA